jgi:hypothetical protein
MTPSILAKLDLIDVINSLSSEVLPELANYLACIQFKISQPEQTENLSSENSFLLSIAGDTSEYIWEEKKYGGADVEAVRCC